MAALSATRIIAKILNKSPFTINYCGLRFETIKALKYFEFLNCRLIVCFGNSNTFGWNYEYLFSYPAVLENKLKKISDQFKVINCGVGGNTSADGLERIETDVLCYNPEIAVVNFGLNDGLLVKSEDRNNNNKKKSNLLYRINENYYKPAVDIEEYKNNIENIILKLKQKSVKIITTGLYEIKKVKLKAGYSEEEKIVALQNEIYRQYDNVLKKLAWENNTVFFDLWNNLYNYEKIKNCFQKDGFHLNTEGYELMAESLKKIIVDVYF
ncbi:MAG: GDSL-type esterase/lipase family protein [Actinobacteria bacterium]|nr:GDSL-type esterase/lipase family protein [Actinomycetota bacterium]MCL6087048.1 GDSL-type esterase/lipase family protein [Actinomycetota bacterium]